jgi:putative Holliday junction resolvase
MPRPAAPEAALPGPAGREEPAGGAPRIVVAFDFGRRRIGVACGDTVSRVSAPQGAVPTVPGALRWTLIVREFAAELQRRHGLQTALVDERYSSREAEARLKARRESGLRRRRIVKSDVDAVAACVILERWFNEQT